MQAAGRRVAYHTFWHVLDLDLTFHLERRTGALSRILERGGSSHPPFISSTQRSGPPGKMGDLDSATKRGSRDKATSMGRQNRSTPPGAARNRQGAWTRHSCSLCSRLQTPPALGRAPIQQTACTAPHVGFIFGGEAHETPVGIMPPRKSGRCLWIYRVKGRRSHPKAVMAVRQCAVECRQLGISHVYIHACEMLQGA